MRSQTIIPGQNRQAAVRLRRLLTLLDVLRSGLSFRLCELAAELEVSSRTVYRDLALLRAAGVPVYFDQVEERYRLDRDRSNQRTKLIPDELLWLAVAAHTSPLAKDPTIGKSIRAAISKLLLAAKPDVARQVSHAVNRCEVEEPSEPHGDTDHGLLQSLFGALANQNDVRLSYVDGNSESSMPVRTRVVPDRITVSPKGWSVSGRSSVHRGTRAFASQQIQGVEIVDS